MRGSDTDTASADLWGRLRAKVGHDRVGVLVSAIAFDALVAVVPLLLLAIAGLGVAIESSSEARREVLDFLTRQLPLAPGTARELLDSLVDDRGWLGVAGGLGLVWGATRLFGTLRGVLEVVFEIPEARRLNWVRGKLHDARMVGVAGSLLLVTIAFGSVAGAARERALGLLPFDSTGIGIALGVAASLLVSGAMFYFLYRHVPGRRIEPLDAGVAAVFATVLFEGAKNAFVFGVVVRPERLAVYGSFASLVAMALWIWLSGLAFVLGAEVASARRWARSVEADGRNAGDSAI